MDWFFIIFGLIILGIAITINNKYPDRREELDAVFEDSLVKAIDMALLVVSGVAGFGLGHLWIIGVYLIGKGLYYLWTSYRVLSQPPKKKTKKK